VTSWRAARLVGSGAAVALAAAAAMLAWPASSVVDGLSMAPGLMPGDVVTTGWLPIADRMRRPRRFDRWIVAAPGGDPAVKRIAGLPGEAVAIRGGDLIVDGEVALKPPEVLAELAVPVMLPLDVGDRYAGLPADQVVDDVAFAREVNRPLEVVHDVGIVALVQTASESSRATVTLSGLTLHWRLPPRSAIRVIAGRLDGHLVAVAWRDRDSTASAPRRSGLPERVPPAWSFTAPCRGDAPGASGPECRLTVDGAARIERADAWRDVHLRPAGDGLTAWQLDDASYVVLGDFPTGSIDSRHWGPLPAQAIRRRITGTATGHATTIPDQQDRSP